MNVAKAAIEAGTGLGRERHGARLERVVGATVVHQRRPRRLFGRDAVRAEMQA